MIKKLNKNADRQIRHARVRKKVFGTSVKPRLNVYRSTNYIYAQIIDDVNGTTLCASSSLALKLEGKSKTEQAKAVGADKLVFLTDIEGLYRDINDKSTCISRLTATEADRIIDSGIIGGGMLPKLNNCTSAIRNGVSRVHILDGRVPHCLLLEIFTKQGIGTAIIADDDNLALGTKRDRFCEDH